jgi:hypothetical protein
MLSFMSHLLRVGAGPGRPVDQVTGTVRRRGSGAQLIYCQLVEVVIFDRSFVGVTLHLAGHHG